MPRRDPPEPEPLTLRTRARTPKPKPNPNPNQADIWSFGASISELCALRHPFAGAASQAALVVRIMAAG